MPNPPYQITNSIKVGYDFAVLTAGEHVLAALEGRPQRCPRRLQCIGEAVFSVLANPGGVNAGAFTAPAGTLLDCDVSAASFSGGPVIAFW
jgi:hypothetical protein